MRLPALVMKLHITIITVFVAVTLPVTATIIIANYLSNQSLIADNSEKFIQKSVRENINNVTRLFNPMLGDVKSFATLMGDRPEYFKEDTSADYLHDIVNSSESVYAAYASFDDGYFRQVRRALIGKKVFDQAVPDATRLISRHIAQGENGRIDHYDVYGKWREKLTELSGPAKYDARVRDFYKNALKQEGANISDPYIFASSGELGITATARVFAAQSDKPIGVAAIDLTLVTLSQFLIDHRVTENSIMMIADQSGKLVAHPEYATKNSQDSIKKEAKTLSALNDDRVTVALAERERLKSDRFVFTVGKDKVEYIGVFSPFPKDFNKPWQLITITPTEDFVGHINATNRWLLTFGIIALIVQILLIYPMSRSISRPLEHLVVEVTNIRRFKFNGHINTKSYVSEVKFLFEAIDLLEKTIASFTLYVPKGLVQQLLGSGLGAKLGVENRCLTILFTDLEGFSTLSEVEPTQQLLLRVSEYFSTVTQAVEAEQGTVDKFIGDAVMAFWGAPKALENHAYLACVAAVRIQRRVAKLNETWISQGLAPLKVRIGIHADDVMVGNIGSTERMSYTVMGDGVNISARLEGVNKEWRTDTCVSHHVFQDAGEYLWLRPIDTVSVKGRRGELLIYDLVAVKNGDAEVAATPEQIALCEMTSAAYALYAQGRFADAEQAYLQVLRRFPTDQVAYRMMAQCQGNLRLSQIAP